MTFGTFRAAGVGLALVLVFLLSGGAAVEATEILISSSAQSRVYRVDAETGLTTDVYAEGIFRAFGAAKAADGRIFVTSEADNIVTFDPAFQGTFESSIGTLFYRDPKDLVFGPDGRLYSGSQTQGIWVFDPVDGTLLDRYGPINAFGLTFGPDGFLYVADAFLERVDRIDPLTGIGTEFVSAGAGGIRFPTGLEFGPDGHLYLADLDEDAVFRFDGSTGAFLDVVITGLLNPFDVAFGPDSSMYVSEAGGSGKIKRFNAQTFDFVDVVFDSGSGSTGLQLTYLSVLAAKEVPEPTALVLVLLRLVPLWFVHRRSGIGDNRAVPQDVGTRPRADGNLLHLPQPDQ